jgi:Mg2+/Co2+ transporter CorB
MMKFENTANINDTIKAFDFKPMPDRPDSFIVGKVIEKGDVIHPEFNVVMFKGYTIEITESSNKNDSRIGDIGYVPFEVDFLEYDERVQLVS